MGTLGDGDGTAGPDTKKDDIYENRPGSKKIIRVVTVMAYMVSVSFVAIVLSAYYVFLWQPPNPRLMHRSHLRGDPQVDYLMDRPPTEVSLNDRVDAIDIKNKVDIFREEIIKNRGINISIIKPKGNFLNMKNETGNNSRITLNPIIRALISTTEIPKTEETITNSTSVYDNISTNVSSETIEASKLFTTTEISKSIDLSSYSTLMEDTLYKKESMNKFTTAIPNMIEDIEKINFNWMLKNSTKKEIEESTQKSQDLFGNFDNKNVRIQRISKEEMTSGSSKKFSIKPEIVRMTEKSAQKPEIFRTTEKSQEITLQPIKLGSSNDDE